MRKTRSIHHQQENEHGLPGSIIAMDKRSVNHFCSPEQTANLGIGPLERRNRVVGSGRDQPNQCSTRLSTGGRKCLPDYVAANFTSRIKRGASLRSSFSTV